MTQRQFDLLTAADVASRVAAGHARLAVEGDPDLRDIHLDFERSATERAATCRRLAASAALNAQQEAA